MEKYNNGSKCIPCELREKVWATQETRTNHEILPVPNLAENKLCPEHDKEYSDQSRHMWEYIAGYAITCNY